MKELILASENKNKIKEAQEIFTEYKIIPISEFKIKFDVEEDGETFKQNAEKKAKTVAEQLNGKACIADDSGIEIEYLNGFPGVKTKRWFNGTDRERNLAIIEKLIGVPKEKRNIKFKSAIAFSDGTKTMSVEAVLNGYVAEEPGGENGFGFDEIFELEDGRTLAELSAEEKNRISHRKLALQDLLNNM